MENRSLAREQLASGPAEPARSIRRVLLGILLTASVLSPGLLVSATGPHGPGVTLLLLAFAIPPTVASLIGPALWPNLTRRRAVARTCIALLALPPGLLVVFAFGFTLCSSDGTTTYVSQNELHATTALAVGAYLVLGSLAVLRRRYVAISWFAAIFTSLMLVLALLAYFGGGPHHCYS